MSENRTLHRGNRTLVVLAQHDGAEVVEKSLLNFANVASERESLFVEGHRQHLARQQGIVPILSPQMMGERAVGETSRLLRPYIRGSAVREVLSREPVGLERAKRWMSELAGIVADLHALRDSLGNPMGMIHRDVTPGNVLIDEKDNVWLNDFGLARLNTDSPLAADETLQGTRSFLSPELLAGDQPTWASDVFQVGLLLAHLLDPRGPKETSDPVRRQWASRQLNPHAVHHAVEVHPAARPTAAELQDLLRA